MADTYRLGPQGSSSNPPGKGPPTTGKPGEAPKPVAGGLGTKPGPGAPVKPVAAAPGKVVTPKPASPPSVRPAGTVARLASLDAYRGFIMILLAASGFGIARFAALPAKAEVWHRKVMENGKERDPTEAEIAARRDWWEKLAFHFEHPAWRSDFLPYPTTEASTKSDWQRVGVSFWDLIQPAFMFMVGAAIPFSYRRRTELGEPLGWRIIHAFFRAVVLILLGVFLYSTGDDRTNWIFTNVLAQIGLGYFFVYLLAGFRWWVQVAMIGIILGGYWYFMQTGYWTMTGKPQPTGQYDYAAVGVKDAKRETYEGKFAPWSKNDNAAHYVDVDLLNKLRDPDGQAMAEWREKMEAGELTWGEWFQMSVRKTFAANTEPFQFNAGGYQTFNFIPSIATMLLGAVMGQLLMGTGAPMRKFLILLLAGLVCLVLGRIAGMYAAPIVKRIWTPSWTLLSGAYVIWMLALFYFLFDMLPLRWLAFPLIVVGMNSIVMYLMGQLMRPFATKEIVTPHLTGLLEVIFGTDPAVDGKLYLLHDQMYGRLIIPTATVFVFWLVAFWLWKRKIFVRI